jgi:hypothetical protein
MSIFRIGPKRGESQKCDSESSVLAPRCDIFIYINGFPSVVNSHPSMTLNYKN